MSSDIEIISTTLCDFDIEVKAKTLGLYISDRCYRITQKGRRHRTYVIGPKDPDHKAKALATEMGASWWSLSVEDRDALRELAA